MKIYLPILTVLLFTSHAIAQLAATPLSSTTDSKRILLSWNTKTNFVYHLETSTNLVQWRTIFKSGTTSDKLQFVDDIPRTYSAQFYRLTVFSTNAPSKVTNTAPSFGYSGTPAPGQPSFGYP